MKTKFRMAYKVTMHSMPNLPKGLIWGIKWNAIKFWANYPVLGTFHPKNRIPSDPPTFHTWTIVIYGPGCQLILSCWSPVWFSNDKLSLTTHLDFSKNIILTLGTDWLALLWLMMSRCLCRSKAPFIAKPPSRIEKKKTLFESLCLEKEIKVNCHLI